MEAQRRQVTSPRSPTIGTPEVILLTPSAAAQDAESFFIITVWQISQSPYLGGTFFQDPLWMPETTDSIEPYILCFLLCIHTYDKV